MRKVLSFVLISALVLSSFSMAFAGSSTELKNLSDIDGNTNAEAIEVNYDLGIVTGNPDGTFQPAKAVTRAEFAAMITRALAIPDSALAGYANTSFKDTSGYAWAVPYLAFCNSKGIMLGDGAGNAMPGKTITVNEAVTMALRAVGYTGNSSELVGVWPSNYVTKAQELKLYDDVAKDAAGVDKANAAQIVYNILTVQKVAVNSDGETKKLWDEEPTTTFDGTSTTLLSAGLNCEAHIDAVVGYDISIDDSLINIAKHIGKFGTVYTNDDDEIVAFISDSDQIVGRFTAADTFTTTDEEKDYNVKVTTIGALMANNTRTNSANVNINTTSLGAFDMTGTEYVLNVDLSGKTVKEIYSAVEWTVTDGDQVAAADIADINEDESLLGADFVLDDNDAIDYTQFQLVGVKSLSDIKVDNVVYVYADADGIRKVEVGTATAEGIVKSYKTTKEDVAAKFAIGANTYKNASEVINGNVDGGSTIEESNVADDVKAVLDARGYVYDFDDTTTANNYAVVEKVSSTIDEQAKLMLTDGTEKTFTYDDDADKAGTLVKGTVIGYGLDKNGKITDANHSYITTNGITLSSKSVIKTITAPATMTASSIAAASLGAITNAKIASDCVVFTYNATDDDYDVTTIDKVEVDKYITGAALLFDENNDGSAKLDKVVAMVIPDSMAKSGDKSYAVLNERNKDANDDGDSVWQIVGFKDGVKVTTLTDDDTASFFSNYTTPDYKAANAAGTFATVKLYEVKAGADGVITDATLITSTTTSDDVHMVAALKATAVDDRASVVMGGTRYAISDKAVIYQLADDDKYKVHTGSLKVNDYVQLYETDDDEDGYDVVVFVRY